MNTALFRFGFIIALLIVGLTGGQFGCLAGSAPITDNPPLEDASDDQPTIVRDLGNHDLPTDQAEDLGAIDPSAEPAPDMSEDDQEQFEDEEPLQDLTNDTSGDTASDLVEETTSDQDTAPDCIPTEERCDFLDNDCSGIINNDLFCQFYAHTFEELYLLDPFLGDTTHITSVPELWDIDTHPDGTLYGVSPTTLFSFNPSSSSWTAIGSANSMGSLGPNAMAIDNYGVAYLMAWDSLYTINLTDGVPTLVGDLGIFISSGDCVVTKGNILYMTSSHDSAQDFLVMVDGHTGSASSIGGIGFSQVYGLTAAWGFLFGVTGFGDLILIDEATGAGERVHSLPGMGWYGAASTPDR